MVLRKPGNKSKTVKFTEPSSPVISDVPPVGQEAPPPEEPTIEKDILTAIIEAHPIFKMVPDDEQQGLLSYLRNRTLYGKYRFSGKEQEQLAEYVNDFFENGGHVILFKVLGESFAEQYDRIVRAHLDFEDVPAQYPDIHNDLREGLQNLYRQKKGKKNYSEMVSYLELCRNSTLESEVCAYYTRVKDEYNCKIQMLNAHCDDYLVWLEEKASLNQDNDQVGGRE